MNIRFSGAIEVPSSEIEKTLDERLLFHNMQLPPASQDQITLLGEIYQRGRITVDPISYKIRTKRRCKNYYELFKYITNPRSLMEIISIHPNDLYNFWLYFSDQSLHSMLIDDDNNRYTIPFIEKSVNQYFCLSIQLPRYIPDARVGKGFYDKSGVLDLIISELKGKKTDRPFRKEMSKEIVKAIVDQFAIERKSAKTEPSL